MLAKLAEEGTRRLSGLGIVKLTRFEASGFTN
jgi:hypothetical protein